MKRHWPVLLLILAVLSLTACGNAGGSGQTQEALNWEVQDFNYTNQEGDALGLKDLEGEIWLTSFIFTNCVTVCPPMTANMVQLQEQLKEDGYEDVQIVSFSVDPEVDDPETLKEYGEQFNVDFSNWHFLTGYTLEEIQQFSQDSFKSFVQPEADSDQIIHGTSFFLVNQTGQVVQKYDGLDPSYEEIVNDINSLR